MARKEMFKDADMITKSEDLRKEFEEGVKLPKIMI